MNVLKTGLLLAALTMLFVWIGNLVGGQGGMVIALLIAMVMNLGAYWFSDKLVLAMYGAQPVEEQEAPELYAMVRRLCARAGLPMPRLYLLPELQPNAFATGRDPHHAAVAVTQGLLQLMEREEIEGVIAHELAHIKNRDTLTMAIVATLAGAIMVLVDMLRWAMIFGGSRDERGGHPLVYLAMIIVAPLAALLIHLAISRAREFEADRIGAGIAGTPIGLANALLKLEAASQQVPMQQGSPTTAHLFIVNPLSGQALMSLFSTHPPIEERVRRLREMAGYALPT